MHAFLRRLRRLCRFVAPTHSGRHHRPAFECLEDRLVLDGTFTVNDTNPSLLSQAITQAENAGGGTVVFAPGVNGTINLTSPLPNLTGNLTITGPGANALTVQGTAESGFTIFTVQSGANVSISGLTISGGQGFDGGGVHNSGDLTLTAVTVDGNTASDEGGGVWNSGNLVVRNSTISNNTNLGAFQGEGAGGIDSEGGTVTIVNSTISGNVAAPGAHSAGGIGIYCTFSPTDVAFISNSTITNNTADAVSGGGIDSTDAGSSTTLYNTIVAGNSGGSGADLAGSGFTSQGHNLIGIGNAGFTVGQGDQVGSSGSPIDAKLGSLANNGGPTKTHFPQSGSPAILNGDSANDPFSDQRGFSRGAGGGAAPAIDIGSVETLVPAQFISLTTTFASAGPNPAPNQPFTFTVVVVPVVVGAGPQVPGGGRGLRRGRRAPNQRRPHPRGDPFGGQRPDRESRFGGDPRRR